MASHQILAEEQKFKSWKVWFSILGLSLTVRDLSMIGRVHFGVYLGVLAVMYTLAGHRAGLFASRNRCKDGLRLLSLKLLHPENYSAFGLSQQQTPARAFIVICLLLRTLGGIGGQLYIFFLHDELEDKGLTAHMGIHS